MLLTQAENQGHTGLSIQLWSGKICGKQWILGLVSPASEKVWDKTLWRWEPAPPPTNTSLVLQGCGCSVDPTPALLRQQKGQLATRPDVSAASGSTWTLCVAPGGQETMLFIPFADMCVAFYRTIAWQKPSRKWTCQNRETCTLVLPKCIWHPSPTPYFCWFSLWSGCRCWKTEGYSLWEAAYRHPTKQPLGSRVGGRMLCNQPLIPAHGAPRHKYWMCPLVNSTKTLLCAHMWSTSNLGELERRRSGINNCGSPTSEGCIIVVAQGPWQLWGIVWWLCSQ